eukprot:6379303-Amphidinium_carterae.2
MGPQNSSSSQCQKDNKSLLNVSNNCSFDDGCGETLGNQPLRIHLLLVEVKRELGGTTPHSLCVDQEYDQLAGTLGSSWSTRFVHGIDTRTEWNHYSGNPTVAKPHFCPPKFKID